MRLFGFGQDMTFFSMLEQQADAAIEAAGQFEALSKDYANFDIYMQKIDDIEHGADLLTHQLANKVDSTFVTPLDKEDLNGISSALDDITDAVEDATGTLAQYRLPTLRSDVPTLAALLLEATQVMREAVGCLRNKSSREAMQPLFIRIHELENKGDDAYRLAIHDLFHAPDRDPFLFIAWKEVYDSIEAAIDKCEDVANTVESVVVKYA